MSTEIREAVTREERNKVFRFWYDIYVREMNRPQKYADHAAGTIIEPLDESGHILMACEDGEIIGTVRANLSSEKSLGYYADLYDMHRFTPFFPGRASINTKLMVSAPYRSSSLSLRLVKASYAFCTKAGVRFDFIDCNSHLKAWFERLGYRQIRQDIDHPEYGRVHPLVLVTHDVEHLRALRSPFLSSLPEHSSDHGSVAFFHTLPNALAVA